MSLPLLNEITIVLISGLIGGIISKKLKLPVIAGYLVTGTILGAFLRGRVELHDIVPLLADMGIALLLFSVGLEFSLDRLSKTTKPALMGALAQVFLTTLIAFWFFYALFHLNVLNAFILAFAVSLSSTSVVLKLLNESKDIKTLHGEVMVSWLIVQDFLTIPVIMLLPLISKGGSNFLPDFLFFVVKVAIVFYLVLILGKRFIPKFFEKLAKLSSKELMLIASFALSLLMGVLTDKYLGSFALGAFLGGFILSSSSLRFEIDSDVRPLRDIFATIFFVSIGFLLDPVFVFQNIITILLLTIFVIILKFVVVYIICSYLSFHSRISFLVSVGLIEIGEFAFVLGRLASAQNIIDAKTYQLIVSATVISLIFTSYFILEGKRLYKNVRRFVRGRSRFIYNFVFTKLDRAYVHIPEGVESYKDHVVLVGYGRVGKIIARVLELSKIKFIVIDNDFKVLEPFFNTEKPFVYGDPIDEDILEIANVKEARLLVIAIPDIHTIEHVTRKARDLNNSIHIIGRSSSTEETKYLNTIKIKDVIEPEFEAAISVSEAIMEDLLGDEKKSRRVISEITKEHLNV